MMGAAALVRRLGAVLMWGLLPIALSGLLEQMSALTITWYRFVVAGVVLVFPVLRSRGLSPVAGAGRSVVRLLVVATACLVANYVLYVLSLKFVSPSAVQRVGLGVLLAGLLLFFHKDIPALGAGGSPLLPGLALLLGAAVTWGI